MGKVKKAISNWAKKAYKDVKKDPAVIERTLARAEKRIRSVGTKATDAYGKAQAGDYFGAAKGAFNTYKAAVGKKQHEKLIESNKAYRRTVNIGGKSFKAAEAFHKGDHESGYKHAMDAARAAVGRAKLEQVKSHKMAQEALAAIHGLQKAKKTGDVVEGVQAYVDKRKNQKEKIANAKLPKTQLLGRNN
jgi:hypothetical protein